jgi:hypothetical protein
LKKQKDAFFSLSPPEQELATPGLVIPPLQGEEPSLDASGVSTAGGFLSNPFSSGLSTAGLPRGFFKPFFLVKDVVPEGPAAIAVNFHNPFHGHRLKYHPGIA